MTAQTKGVDVLAAVACARANNRAAIQAERCARTLPAGSVAERHHRNLQTLARATRDDAMRTARRLRVGSTQ